MRRFLKVSADAEIQIRKAARWWCLNRSASPGLFRHQLERGFELISGEAGVAQETDDVSAEAVRRLHLPRIHYFLYYRIVDQDVVEVLALWHTSRGTPPPHL